MLIKKSILEIESEDLHFLIEDLENTFEIHFNSDFFKNKQIEIDDLTGYIYDAIGLIHSEHCTPQVVFYRLRRFFTLYSNKSNITPDTSLEILFPKEERKTRIKALEHYFNTKMRLLKLPYWVNVLFILSAIFSMILIYFKSSIFWVSLFALPFFYTWVLKFSNILIYKDLRQLSKYITQNRYAAANGLKGAINPKEIKDIVIEKLLYHLSLETKDVQLQTVLKW